MATAVDSLTAVLADRVTVDMDQLGCMLLGKHLLMFLAIIGINAFLSLMAWT